MAQIICINRYQTGRAHSQSEPRRCACVPASARERFLRQETAKWKVWVPAARILRLEDLRTGAWNQSLSASQRWDFIYSSDLLASMPEPAAQQIVKAAAYHLKPGGCLLLANLTHDSFSHDCEICAPPSFTRRNELDMAVLARSLSDQELCGQVIYRDSTNTSVYLELHRAPDARFNSQPQTAA